MSIKALHFSFSYDQNNVLSDINFEIADGQLVSVLGPNGVGKSTLFRCILGLLHGYSGDLTLNGKEIRECSARELAHQIAYIPQTRTQSFNYSAFEMVLMGTTHQMAPFDTPRQKQKDIAMTAMQQIGVDDLAGKSYGRLSGGEQQLILVARALAQQTNILLMDEPTSNLDYGNQSHVLQRVRQLADDGYTILLSTHNPQHALFYSDTILALCNQKIAAFGSPDDVINEDLISMLYGIQVRFVNTNECRLIVPESEIINKGDKK